MYTSTNIIKNQKLVIHTLCKDNCTIMLKYKNKWQHLTSGPTGVTRAIALYPCLQELRGGCLYLENYLGTSKLIF